MTTKKDLHNLIKRLSDFTQRTGRPQFLYLRDLDLVIDIRDIYAYQMLPPGAFVFRRSRNLRRICVGGTKGT